MASPTDHETGPLRGRATTPPGVTTSTGSITPTGFITPTGTTIPTGATTPTDITTLPFRLEHLSFKRAPPQDRFRIAETDGDVVLHFDSPKGKTEIIVSSKILSEASPVFRKLLAPEPRDPIYSNEKPLVMQIEDWNLLSGMVQLCLVLHGKADKIIGRDDDGALALLRFAQVAKKFRAVEFLKPVITYSLLAPFVPRVSERGNAAFDNLGDLATAAYLLNQEQLFQLFTRRLIMDHCKLLSTCSDEMFEVIPAKAICEFNMF